MFNEINRRRLFKGISLATKFWAKASGPGMLSENASVLALGQYGYLYNQMTYSIQKNKQSVVHQEMSIRQKKDNTLVLEHFNHDIREITAIALNKDGQVIDSVISTSKGSYEEPNSLQTAEMITNGALLLASPAIQTNINNYNFLDNAFKNKGGIDYENALDKARAVIDAAMKQHTVQKPGLHVK